AAAASSAAIEALRDARATPVALRSIETRLAKLAAMDPAYGRRNGDSDREAPLGAEMRVAFDGLRCLWSDSLTAEFLGLSSDELRRELIRRYWALRDPTPTTPENERRDEHERRVRYARDHFAQVARPYWDARGGFYIRFGAPGSIQEGPADVRRAV